MNKKSTVILLIAILTISACAAFAIPKAKADYSDVKILSYSTYVTSAASYTSRYAGDFIVVGEIQNQGTEVFELPQITATIYTTDGLVVAQTGNSAYVKDLLPGQKAPFYIDFSPEFTISPDSNGEVQPGTNGNYTGTVGWIPYIGRVQLSLWAAATNDTMYRGVGIQTSTAFNINGVYSVTGFLQNNGTQKTGDVWVVTTFYNETGGVVACNFTEFLDQTTHAMEPGSTITYQAAPMDNTAALSSKITSYSSLVQTRAYDPSEVATPTPTGNPTTPPPSGTITTPPSQTAGPNGPIVSSTVVYAVVGAVVIAAAIVAMLFIRKRRT